MQHRKRECSISSDDTNSNSPITLTESRNIKSGLSQVQLAKENFFDPKYKTELCKKFSEKGYCPYGNKCRFAHGKEELFNKMVQSKQYKQKECNSFFHNYYCNYGSRCHFKHDERKVNEINKSFYTHLINNLSLVNSEIITQMSYDEMVIFLIQNTPSCMRTYLSRFI